MVSRDTDYLVRDYIYIHENPDEINFVLFDIYFFDSFEPSNTITSTNAEELKRLLKIQTPTCLHKI
jgi:hypothetical protein